MSIITLPMQGIGVGTKDATIGREADIGGEKYVEGKGSRVRVSLPFTFDGAKKIAHCCTIIEAFTKII